MKENQDTIPSKDKSVEELVRTYYDNFGWVEVDSKKVGEDISNRNFRTAYYPYNDGVQQRIRDCFSKLSGTLLIAGCGDMPEDHIKIARLFTELSCLDISQKALEIAKSKLGEKARYVLGSILKLQFRENTFDAVFCSHVIYHIDLNLQEAAIEELIRVTKPGGRIVVLYSNPGSIIQKVIWCTRLPKKIRRLVSRSRRNPLGPSGMSVPEQQSPPLPLSLHPLRWWKRFEPRCKVTFRPGTVMNNYQEGILIHSDWFASFIYRCSSWIEKTMPNAVARLWHHPIIIIDKPMAALPPGK